MKKCKLVAIVLSVVLVLMFLMQYDNSNDSVVEVDPNEILVLKDSLVKKKEELIKFRDSIDVEMKLISDSISIQLVDDSIRNAQKINAYEKISNSDIDGVYVDIKLYLDSIEIPKQ